MPDVLYGLVNSNSITLNVVSSPNVTSVLSGTQYSICLSTVDSVTYLVRMETLKGTAVKELIVQ